MWHLAKMPPGEQCHVQLINKCVGIFRCDVKDEFDKLIKNKEIVISKKDSFEIPRLRLTDYNYATPSATEQQHYIDFLLESQVNTSVKPG